MQHHRHRVLLLCLALLPAATGCVSAGFVRVVDTSNFGVELASTTDPDGSSSAWRLYPGATEEPRIDRTTTKVEVVPRLGVAVSAVTRERADAEGLAPWRGVFVDRVDLGSPAARIELVRGDVILQVAGEDVTSAEQFTELLLAHGKPDQPLELTLYQRRRGGDPLGAEGERTDSTRVTIVPTSDTVRSTATDSFELAASRGIQHYTGLQIATVPEDLALSIYGERRAVPILTGVVTGSPAYYAGFRAGDRVLSCDGRSIGTLDELRAAVLERASAIDERLKVFDLRDGAPADARPTTPNRLPLQLGVTGPLGPHAGEVEVRDDLGEDVEFYVPILTCYESSVNKSHWSLLDFIFQFGFNYKSRVYPSTSRAAVESSHFSLFPFGMFEISQGPESSSYRLFWFIRFGTER